jgi:hypothetical protein
VDDFLSVDDYPRPSHGLSRFVSAEGRRAIIAATKKLAGDQGGEGCGSCCRDAAKMRTLDKVQAVGTPKELTSELRFLKQ